MEFTDLLQFIYLPSLFTETALWKAISKREFYGSSWSLLGCRTSGWNAGERSTAYKKMDVNQAKQEHLLALKGTSRFAVHNPYGF